MEGREGSYIGGTKEGGRKAAATNKQLFGDDWYSRIGAMGGRWDDPQRRWCARHPELASIHGKKGGQNSRRPATPLIEEVTPQRTHWYSRKRKEK